MKTKTAMKEMRKEKDFDCSAASALPNFCVSFPQPMIFWNARRWTSLYAQVACVINKTERGVASGRIRVSKRRTLLCLLLLPITLFMAKTLRSQSQNSPKKSEKAGAQNPAAKSPLQMLSPAAQHWVDATMRKMSVDEKIGQLLFTTYHGTFTSTDSPAYQQMLHSVNDLHVGGF